MKKNDFMLNILLSIVLGVVLMAMVIGNMIQPWAVFPEMNLPAMAGVIVGAMVLNYFLCGETLPSGQWITQTVLAAVTFGVLLWVAGVIQAAESVTYALCGGGMFAVLTLAFDSMVKRMETTCENKMAVIPAGFILFLACQCLAGMVI